MTPDIERLRGCLGELVDDPEWGEPSNTSYLSAKDRENPDIMANVEAMAATNKLIAWFGRDQEGFVGLWRTAAKVPLEEAAVVRLDSEGQYSIVATKVPDYLAVSVDEDSFDDARAALVDAGFEVAGSREAIWSATEGLDEPQAFRRERYNEGRKRRGLEPV